MGSSGASAGSERPDSGDQRARATRALALTAVLGSLFLTIQGVEWVRLVGHGLTLGSGAFGATFYVLIGCHGVHVLVAVMWLATTALLARAGRFTAARHAAKRLDSLLPLLVQLAVLRFDRPDVPFDAAQLHIGCCQLSFR